MREACADRAGPRRTRRERLSSSPSPRHLAHSRRPRRSRSGSRVGRSACASVCTRGRRSHGRGLRGDGRAPRGADCRVRKRRPDPRLGIDPRSPTRGRRPRPRLASLQGSRSGRARLPARSQEFPPEEPARDEPAGAGDPVSRQNRGARLGRNASRVCGCASPDAHRGWRKFWETRLALQSAAEVAERFSGGVSWISLNPLTDASLVADPHVGGDLAIVEGLMYDSSGRAITASLLRTGLLAVRRYCSATIPC